MKRSISFVDANKNRANVSIELKQGNLSMSGDMGGRCGQILDSINPTEAQKPLIEVWKKYHLNGMSAGSPEQNKILELCDSSDYDKQLDFLDSYTIDGKAISHMDYIKISVDRENLKRDLEAVKIIKKALEALKNIVIKPSGGYRHLEWVKFEDLNLIPDSVIDVLNVQGSKIMTEGRNTTYSQKARREIESTLSVTESRALKIQKELNNALISTARYVEHDDKVVAYGGTWFKTELPDDLTSIIDETINNIREEGEQTNGAPLSSVEEALEVIEDERIAVLAAHLKLSKKEAQKIEHVENLFSIQGADYYCGTPEQLKREAANEIENTLYAFNPNFLSKHTGEEKEVFKNLSELCENGNSAIKSIIDNTIGFDKIVDETIKADGFGSILNRYDGEAHSFKVGESKYLICRAY